jgi:uncharacterized membrane protein
MWPSPPEQPPTPEEQRSPKYWLGQLWGIWRRVLVFAFAGLGVALLFRFGPGAMLILVPVGVLLFGSAIFAGVRIWMRGKR